MTSQSLLQTFDDRLRLFGRLSASIYIATTAASREYPSLVQAVEDNEGLVEGRPSYSKAFHDCGGHPGIL